ncbi:MAG: calcium-binding protein [Gammaproteobacteria bacterium]
MKIAKLYEYAWFADLAYVEWRDEVTGDSTSARQAAVEDANTALRAPELTLPVFGLGEVGETIGPALATKIFDVDAEAWYVVHHQPNTPSGFSATLFAQSGSGEQVLAVRGTETTLDQLGPDLFTAGLQEIGGLGMALSQTVDLVNYVSLLQAPAGEPVAQLTLHRGLAPPPGAAQTVTGDGEAYWLTVADPASGLGLFSADAPLGVTGHSLGGHLAALALRLFPARFGQAVIFNAPGFDPVLGLNDSEALITGLATTVGSGGTAAALQILSAVVQNGQQLTDTLIGELFAPHLAPAPETAFIDLAGSGRIISLVSEDQAPGNDLAGVSQLWLTGIPASPRQALTVEINSHAMSGMVDALGVQALFERIDPALGLADAGELVALASNRGGNAEERLVDSLSRLFLGTGLPLLGEASAGGVAQWIARPEPYYNRGSLHQRLIELEHALDGTEGLSIVRLGDLAATELAARATEHIAWRYALVELNPFVVLGDDSLYADHAATLGPDVISPAYLEDRAAFLAALVARNAADQAVAIPGPEQLEFVDATTAERVAVRSELNWPRRRALFGSSADDAEDVLGGSDSTIDHLYGGAGDDLLAGYARDDYLEGGDGDDELRGGPGRDVLYGNDGNDTLYGNERENVDDHAADQLFGGNGHDRYFVGDGDIVLDADGAGEIFVGPDKLSLAGSYARVAERVYRQTHLDATLYLQDDAATLVAFGFAQPVRIRLLPPDGTSGGFRSGDFSIVLDDGGPGTSSPDPIMGTPGHDALAAGAALVGTDGDDHIDGDAGDDDVFGGRGVGPWGRDVLIGGAGDDYLDSATPLDVGRVADLASDPGELFVAGAGRDIAVGNGGDDIILGGRGDDFLSGRAGRDILDGGEDDDVLSGGADEDLLFGGSGNDYLFGGFDVWATPARGWTAAPVYEDGRVVDVVLSDVYLGANPPPADADTLFGGDGDDFLNGGAGRDVLYGEAGDDILFGWRGDDVLHGGAGNDVLYGDSFGHAAAAGDGDDCLFGGAGDDELWGEGGSDVLDGGAGDDRLDGGLGDDVLYGGPGDDSLDGGSDNDILHGGPGRDVLRGGPGNDRFVYRLGDGHDVIEDSAGYDLAIVEGVVNLDAVPRSLRGHDLVFDFDAMNSLTLVDWGRRGVDEVRAGQHVLRAGGPLDMGTTGSMVLVSQHDGETVPEGGTVSQHDGETVPEGGSVYVVDVADAALVGGPGHDRYVIGDDVTSFTVDDAGGVDVIELPAGIAAADVDVRLLGQRVQLTAGALSIDLGGAAIERLVFADGGELGPAWFAGLLPQAPSVRHPLTDASAYAGQVFDYQVPIGTFVDANPGDILTLAADLGDGRPLPHWLDFASSSGRFSGVAPWSARGRSYAVAVTATDDSGLAATDVFHIDVLAPAAATDATAIVRPADIAVGNGLLSAATQAVLDNPDSALARDFLDGAGDLNGDGIDDLIRFSGDGFAAEARVEVRFGRAGRDTAVLTEQPLTGRRGFVITGIGAHSPETLFEYGLARRDVDGDGIDDLILAAADFIPGGDVGPATARVIHGRYGDFPPDLAWSSLPEVTAFPTQDEAAAAFFPALSHAGEVLAQTDFLVGDVNGDGIDDRIHPAPTGDREHIVAAVVFGSASAEAAGGVLEIDVLDGSRGFVIEQGFAELTDGIGVFGSHLQVLGDINGDGFDDLGVGAVTYSVAQEEHYAAVVYGKPGGYGGRLDLAALDGSNGFLAAVPASPGFPYPSYARAAGDIDGDGLADVIVTGGYTQSSHVLYGALAADLPVTLGTAGADLLTVNQAGEIHTGGGDDDVTLIASGTVRLDTGSGRDLIRFGSGTDNASDNFAPGTSFHVRGGSGEDIYVVATTAGSLRIRISDPVTAAGREAPEYGGNRLLFAAGYDPQTLALRRGSLALDFGDEGSAIHLESFDPEDVLGGPRDIETFEFADGTVIDYAALVARGFDVVGGAGDDQVHGTNLADRLVGHAGNDVLDGGAGNDVLDGGPGDDTYILRRGDGRDRIADSGGFDRVIWGQGISLADLDFSIDGSDLEFAVAGGDRVTFAAWFDAPERRIEAFEFADGTTVATADVVPDPSPGPGSEPPVGGVLRGTRRADVLRGTSGPDRVYGGPGNDDIATFGGADRIYGGAGHDPIRGGSGNDVIHGGAGRDRLFGGAGRDLIFGGPGHDRLYGGPGHDRLFGGDGNDVVVAGSGKDVLRGGPGHDRLYGGSGQDRLFGGRGNDVLVAGIGNDVLRGGPGNDVLRAGHGHNRLIGGSGSDRYVIGPEPGRQVIVDHGGARDSLRFAARDLAPHDVEFRRRGRDLVVDLPHDRGAVTIAHWYTHPRYRIERIDFAEGTAFTAAGVERLVQSMAAFSAMGGTAQPLPDSMSPAFEPMLALAQMIA